MQPKSHRHILEVSLRDAGRPWLTTHASRILDGNDDEDMVTLRAFGRSYRFPSFGLSHTYRPGSRYGELWAPSSKRRCAVFMERAGAFQASDPARSAWWLGRACHLIIDAAVPARAHRVWHFSGDPLESWVEENIAELASLPRPIADRGAAGDVIETLASIAMTFPADSTKTVWGSTKHRMLGLGIKLAKADLERQACLLVPATIAHLSAFLAEFAR